MEQQSAAVIDFSQPDNSVGSYRQAAEIVQRITAEKDNQVSRKALIEERWIEDLRGFYGRYDSVTEANLKTENRSRLYVNQTRPKTNNWAARLGDLMFPVDGENWGIDATPVPVLSRNASQALESARQQADAATRARDKGDQQAEQDALAAGRQAGQEAVSTNQQIAEAKKRALLMMTEMKDQLGECQYNIRQRMAIMDACRLGTGIMKGPMAKHRVRSGWAKNEQGGYELQRVSDPRPEYLRVDPWAFYPDMNASAASEMEFSYQRHLPSKADLRKWARIPGFNQKCLSDIITSSSFETLPYYIQQLRDITSGGGDTGIEKRYTAWEYHGAISPNDLALLARIKGDTDTLKEIDDDPLEEYPIIMWFLGPELLKWSPHPMDSGETLYSVFNFETDDTCIFGFGVPYLMRDSQAAINAAWRMTMDNAGLSSGPQIIIDESRITPADGKWELRPKKIWKLRGESTTGSADPFMVREISTRQTELQAIITIARQFSDDETSMPPIAYGDAGAQVTRTAQGMAILMNSVNVTFRRVVKNYDDQMTVPSMRRLYDWNMQFSKRDEIKGDFDVSAKGSSVLLVRELEAQNLMQIATNFAAHPVFGPMTKAIELYRKLISAHLISPDDIVKTQEELDQEAAKLAAAGGPPPTPEQEKLASNEKIKEAEIGKELMIARFHMKTEMLKLAQNSNLTLEEIKASMGMKQAEIDADERALAAEAAMAQQTGIHAEGKL